MIDPADRQTQSLPLEQPAPAKRGRGRPATGQALSNAERQRRYRENLKAQRNEKMHQGVAEDLRAELANAIERAEKAEAEVAHWKKLATMAERARQNLAEELRKRNEKPAKVKRHKDEPAAPLSEWAVYGKTHKSRKNWTRLTPEGEEFATEELAIKGVSEVQSLGKTAVYTVFKVT
jgi:hypothetical protein